MKTIYFQVHSITVGSDVSSTEIRRVTITVFIVDAVTPTRDIPPRVGARDATGVIFDIRILLGAEVVSIGVIFKFDVSEVKLSECLTQAFQEHKND